MLVVREELQLADATLEAAVRATLGQSRSLADGALESAVRAQEGWASKYECFERFLRHEHYGEPHPPASEGSAPSSSISSTFYPKLRQLRDAIQRVEASTGRDFFEELLPNIVRLAEAALPDLTPLSPGEARSVPRSSFLSLLSNAVLLNLGRGGALDFLSGGEDPLYVSGARLAEEKCALLLTFLARCAPAADDAETTLEVRWEEEAAEEEEAEEEPEAEAADALLLDDPSVANEALVTLACLASGPAAPPRALLVAASARFGGGAVRGLSATPEEVQTLRYPESLLALALAPRPLGRRGALLLHGLRPWCQCSGSGHRFRFSNVIDEAVASQPTTTLLCVDPSRAPAAGQFEASYLRRELGKLVAALRALRRLEGDGACSCQVDGLWGDGGFSGAQPGLRLLLLCAAARVAGVRLHVVLPYDEAEPSTKFLRALVAEIDARRPSARELWGLMTSSVAARNRRLWTEVPAYASFAIRTLRGAATTGGGPGAGAAVGSRTREGEANGGEAERAAATKRARASTEQEV